jgi:hypothetical protein
MSRRVELILVIRQKNIILPQVESTMVKCIHVAIRVRYSELICNQQNGSIVKGVPRDWSRRIHSVNKVPRLNFPCCTYCH